MANNVKKESFDTEMDIGYAEQEPMNFDPVTEMERAMNEGDIFAERYLADECPHFFE